jgi:hypothetical protein
MSVILKSIGLEGGQISYESFQFKILVFAHM